MIENWGVLGFEEYEIATVRGLVDSGMAITKDRLRDLGFSPYETQRAMQIKAIMTGKKEIEDIDSLSRHLKGIHVGRSLNMQDLENSKVFQVPRKAIIHDIKDETFKMYNSANFSKFNYFYDVKSVTGARVVIETARKPVLKFKQSKKVDGVIEIQELLDDGRVKIAVNREYAELCNRYIIVTSFRKPDLHHGCVKIVAMDGTKVYVAARSVGNREKLDHIISSNRVYDHGIFKDELLSKLMIITESVFMRVKGKHLEYENYTEEYQLIKRDKENSETELEIED